MSLYFLWVACQICGGHFRSSNTEGYARELPVQAMPDDFAHSFGSNSEYFILPQGHLLSDAHFIFNHNGQKLKIT